MSGEPYPKGKQLARGQRRYRRKVASPKQWQAIIAAKQGPCRVCCHPNGNGHGLGLVEFTSRAPGALQSVARSLTDAEYAYVIGKLGEGGMARLFGVTT
jgi:hypothetical protein